MHEKFVLLTTKMMLKIQVKVPATTTIIFGGFDLQEIFGLPSYASSGIQPNTPFTYGGVFTIASPTWVILPCSSTTTPGSGTSAPGTGNSNPSTGTTNTGTSNPGAFLLSVDNKQLSKRVETDLEKCLQDASLEPESTAP